MLLIHRQFFGVDEFVFYRFKEVIITLEAHFQCPVGYPFFPLEQFKDLGKNFIEGHE